MSEKKKVISVMIPTYNEEENARPIYEAEILLCGGAE